MIITQPLLRILGCFILAFALFAFGDAAPSSASGSASAQTSAIAEFIAVSESPMNWRDARAWCEQQGGRLPLINGAASLTATQIIDPGTVFIDGFGQINTGQSFANWNTPWPSGLPYDFYWTGTGRAGRLGLSWSIDGNGGFIFVGDRHQSLGSRVVCVP